MEERREGQRDGVCGARDERAPDGGPPHQRRYGADDGTNPRIPERASLQPRVWPRVKRDIRRAEQRRRRITHHHEQRGAREARGGRKSRGVCGAHCAPDEGAPARARHLRVVGHLLELVERVRGRAAERRAERR